METAIYRILESCTETNYDNCEKCPWAKDCYNYHFTHDGDCERCGYGLLGECHLQCIKNDWQIKRKMLYYNHRKRGATMNDLARRITVLKNCHEIMRHLNNEEAYFEWIVEGVPDCPREEDFESICENDSFYLDCLELFSKIFKAYFKDETF